MVFMAFIFVKQGTRECMDIDNTEVKELEARWKITSVGEGQNGGMSISCQTEALLLNNFIGVLQRLWDNLGFTILGAVVIYILRQSVLLNLLSLADSRK